MKTRKIKIWAPDLDLVSPIDEIQITEFKEWVQYNGFRTPQRGHGGFDFASYLTKDGACYLGLPPETVVRAVMGGIVAGVRKSNFAYSNEIIIDHGKQGDGVYSVYCHILPIVKEGQIVKTSQPIAKLFHQKKEGSSTEQLIHLHFGMANSFESIPIDGRYTLEGAKQKYIDPIKILFPDTELPAWQNYRDISILSQKTLDEKVRFPERM